MSEPQIQYAQTKDGVNVAFCESGRGEPLVWVTDLPFSNILLEEQYMPGSQDILLGTGRLIRLDPRGMGMSDRNVDRYTLDGWVRDIEAVAGRLALDHFALGGVGYAGLIVIAYAVRHPEQVSELILVNASARPADGFATPQAQSLGQMLVTDWEMFSENAGGLAFGWGKEQAVRYGEFVRAAITQTEARRVYGALAQMDVTDLLPSIASPTLAIHYSGLKYNPIDLARRMVSAIPDARLVILEGQIRFGPEAMSGPVIEFLGNDAGAVKRDESGSLRTVFFTDLVGHTEMMSRLGDERGRDVLREHERITREVLKANGGTEVKTMGDGFMASFGSVTKAVECAVALQRAFADHDGEALNVRVGLNAGEPIEEDGDLFGATVILASRIAAKAGGGEILVADTVRGLCSGKGFVFTDRGEFVAKGFEEPVRISEVSWRG